VYTAHCTIALGCKWVCKVEKGCSVYCTLYDCAGLQVGLQRAGDDRLTSVCVIQFHIGLHRYNVSGVCNSITFRIG